MEKHLKNHFSAIDNFIAPIGVVTATKEAVPQLLKLHPIDFGQAITEEKRIKGGNCKSKIMMI